MLTWKFTFIYDQRKKRRKYVIGLVSVVVEREKKMDFIIWKSWPIFPSVVVPTATAMLTDSNSISSIFVPNVRSSKCWALTIISSKICCWFIHDKFARCHAECPWNENNSLSLCRAAEIVKPQNEIKRLFFARFLSGRRKFFSIKFKFLRARVVKRKIRQFLNSAGRRGEKKYFREGKLVERKKLATTEKNLKCFANSAPIMEIYLFLRPPPLLKHRWNIKSWIYKSICIQIFDWNWNVWQIILWS